MAYNEGTNNFTLSWEIVSKYKWDERSLLIHLHLSVKDILIP
jgi:hypothetical protein